MSTTVVVHKTYELTDEFIQDAIIETAGYGIGYWATAAEVDEKARTYTVTDYNEEDYDVYVLTYQDLGDAFLAVALGEAGVNSEIVGWAAEALLEIQDGEEFPGGSIDATVADVIVQYAIFGEVIYG